MRTPEQIRDEMLDTIAHVENLHRLGIDERRLLMIAVAEQLAKIERESRDVLCACGHAHSQHSGTDPRSACDAFVREGVRCGCFGIHTNDASSLDPGPFRLAPCIGMMPDEVTGVDQNGEEHSESTEVYDDDSKELLALVTAASDWVDSMGDSVAGYESSLSREEIVLHAAVTEWRARVRAIGSTPMPTEQGPMHAAPIAGGVVAVLDVAAQNHIKCVVERVDTERQTVIVRQNDFLCFEVPIEIVDKELREVGRQVRLVLHHGLLTGVERM